MHKIESFIWTLPELVATEIRVESFKVSSYLKISPLQYIKRWKVLEKIHILCFCCVVLETWFGKYYFVNNILETLFWKYYVGNIISETLPISWDANFSAWPQDSHLRIFTSEILFLNNEPFFSLKNTLKLFHFGLYIFLELLIC